MSRAGRAPTVWPLFERRHAHFPQVPAPAADTPWKGSRTADPIRRGNDMNQQANSAIAASDEAAQYLTVNLGNEEYGVDILAVREIRGWTLVTRIPQAPSYVLGVLNLRGAIVPVLDLRLRFGLEREEYTDTTVCVIVMVAGRQFGVVVDAVSDVVEVIPGAIRPVPDMGTTVDTEYLKGLTSVGERMVLLLDVDRLLQPQDAQMLEAALASSEVKAVA